MAKVHGQALLDSFESLLQLATIPSGTVKMYYLKSYTPNPDDAYYSDISASVAAGAPVVTVAGLAVNYDATNDRMEIDFTDPSNASITTETDGIALVLDTGVAATSPVIYTTAIANLIPTDGTLSLTIDAQGLFALGTNAA